MTLSIRSRFTPLLAPLIFLMLAAGCSANDGEEQNGNPEQTNTVSPEVAANANEGGLIMVLEYHRVGGDPHFAPEWTISAGDFRAQLQHLYDNDYYPVNFRDFVNDEMNVPAGKTPVVLTFDDSSDTQFTMAKRGGRLVPDPEGAVGVMADFSRKNPEWPTRATFFVLPEADAPNNLFGQPEHSKEKLNYLVDNGMEIGTHTLYHENLALASPEEVQRQIVLSIEAIQQFVPGYEVDTLGVPFGEYPSDINLLKSGSYKGKTYELDGAVEVTGGATYPPGHPEFDPYHVPRIQAEPFKADLQYYFDYFEENPEDRYVSDGDPDTKTIPEPVMEETTGAVQGQY
ncbi:polysaccharide deacetylase family protein [Rubrobacter indicoceani]|uniref:polysaccharide deacetylase family protein n=1 Tax=Rubrobacter indicoceani TaxID=2051957 RepID=UPI000E5BD52D|nr:polysaccharide deacetylase family protein [Rubrobacter indicoceani]